MKSKAKHKEMADAFSHLLVSAYEANEKFSDRGHTAHIRKASFRLSTTEKAEAKTINRLMNFPVGRLSANEKTWLENRLKDRCPEAEEDIPEETIRRLVQIECTDLSTQEIVSCQ